MTQEFIRQRTNYFRKLKTIHMKRKNILFALILLFITGTSMTACQPKQNRTAILKCTIARGSTGCQHRLSLCNCCWFCNTGTLGERERLMTAKVRDGNLVIHSSAPFPKDSVDYFEIEPGQVLEGTSELGIKEFALKEGHYTVVVDPKGGSGVSIPVTIIK
jgi:hypothetical protein